MGRLPAKADVTPAELRARAARYEQEGYVDAVGDDDVGEVVATLVEGLRCLAVRTEYAALGTDEARVRLFLTRHCPWLAGTRGAQEFEAALRALLCINDEPRLASHAEREGVPMLLFCPRCSKQHVDAPDGDWTNPPHATHTCKFCGLLWRPSNTNTEGVERIEAKEAQHAQRIANTTPHPAPSAASGLDALAEIRELVLPIVNYEGWQGEIFHKLQDLLRSRPAQVDSRDSERLDLLEIRKHIVHGLAALRRFDSSKELQREFMRDLTTIDAAMSQQEGKW